MRGRGGRQPVASTETPDELGEMPVFETKVSMGSSGGAGGSGNLSARPTREELLVERRKPPMESIMELTGEHTFRFDAEFSNSGAGKSREQVRRAENDILKKQILAEEKKAPPAVEEEEIEENIEVGTN